MTVEEFMRVIHMKYIQGRKDHGNAEKFMKFRRAARNSMQFMLEEALQVKVLPSGLAFFAAAITAMAEGMTEEEMVKGVRDAFKLGEAIIPKDKRDEAREFWKGKRDDYAKGKE